MSVRYAFVTLLTSDAYLPGALTIAAALKDVHRALPADQTVEHETVCLVTPEIVDVSSIRSLRRAFNVVIGVEMIIPPDTESLALLGRPDLGTALTKLHVFRLTQYSKVIFLDADVLPLRPLSHLFHLDHDFSAIPDVGWPDIFNSGVMVLSPGDDKFKQLQELLNTKGTWDGADQGLLNEWRGDNWNKLSFTYNTTPTAIYTYAPAYQRFGSQISVLHFIGPHKPWHSIPHRTPSSSTHSMEAVADPATETPVVHLHAYDYGSLVDRWYSIYDRHYRCHGAEPVFQPTKYTSAWNGVAPRDNIVAGGALGLEELRRIALEGMGTLGVLAPRTPGVGEYRTLPLEGRFDLIRPKTRAERMQAQEDCTETSQVQAQSAAASEPSTPLDQIISLPPGSPVRWTTLPTPGINEIPPAPHTRLMSLPPTPLRHVCAPHELRRTTREAGAQTVPIQQQEREPGWADVFRAPSMPNPFLETPSTTTLTSVDTYFPKLWDIDRNWASVSPSSSETSITTIDPSPSKSPSISNVPFGPAPAPAILHTSRGQGQSRNFTGEGNGPVTPDLAKKVKRVFPWEERPPRAPGRVFPDDEPLSTALRRHPVAATPERKAIFRSPMPSPLVGFPPSLQSHYPWDGMLPQKRTHKAAWSASPSPLGLVNGLDGVETGSQDGDVEDEVDFEDERIMRSRSPGTEKTKRTLKYRSIGVQTDARELREEGVQVTISAQVTEGATITTSSSAATADISISTPHMLDSSRLLFPSNPSDRRTRSSRAPDEVGGVGASFAPSLAEPPAGSHTLSNIGKGSRVWDPARGVEAFKRESEEVLAKFMKTGSWEERA